MTALRFGARIRRKPPRHWLCQGWHDMKVAILQGTPPTGYGYGSGSGSGSGDGSGDGYGYGSGYGSGYDYGY